MQHTFIILCALPFDIHVQSLRLSTMTINGRHYATSLTTRFFLTYTLHQRTSRSSDVLFLDVLPDTIPNPIPSKFHPNHHPQHRRFFAGKGKMGYSPAVWAGEGGKGEQAYMQAGSFGHQKNERKIPCREEKRRLTSHLGTQPRLGFLQIGRAHV